MLTLPRHHPVKTALIAAAEEMTEEERQRLGFDLFLKSRLPEFLHDPAAGWRGCRDAVLFEFGVFADYPDSLANFVLPQLGGFLNAFEGLNFTGEKLLGADGGSTLTRW